MYLINPQGGLIRLNLTYETYHTRILFFERYVHALTYSILAYAYPRALICLIVLSCMSHLLITEINGDICIVVN